MFNDTIRFNLRYGKRDATDDELEQAANDAQLLDFIDNLENGWETMVGDRGLKLSGGEQQRAAIARCLLKDPPFVCKECNMCVFNHNKLDVLTFYIPCIW